MINKALLEKRFSENAPTYDQYAQVQKIMARVLTKGITGSPLRILEVGCGTGYLTKQLCSLFPEARIQAVDLAPGMLEVARRRVQGQQVEFVCGDIEEMESLGGPFDLIISNAAFQWFNHVEDTVQRLCASLSPEGVLRFSTFGDLTFHELHTSFEKATQHLAVNAGPPGQSFYSLSELITLCQRAVGSQDRAEITGREGLEIETFAHVREFFHSIKKIGAANSNATTYSQRPSVLKKMMSFYEQDFRQDHGVRATYHCLYINIKKRG